MAWFFFSIVVGIVIDIVVDVVVGVVVSVAMYGPWCSHVGVITGITI
jgi:hypothetical protein